MTNSNEQTAALFGAFDLNTRMIEEAFDVRISNRDRESDHGDAITVSGEKQFVDMQAKRGNSGGPVIDRETGLVVGILCGSQTEGDSRLVEEINYIRPIKYIWETFAEEIK